MWLRQQNTHCRQSFKYRQFTSMYTAHINERPTEQTNEGTNVRTNKTSDARGARTPLGDSHNKITSYRTILLRRAWLSVSKPVEVNTLYIWTEIEHTTFGWYCFIPTVWQTPTTIDMHTDSSLAHTFIEHKNIQMLILPVTKFLSCCHSPSGVLWLVSKILLSSSVKKFFFWGIVGAVDIR